MQEIICPHCGKAFKIDEAGYADILKQVRDSAFEQQLHERLELAEKDKLTAVELARTNLTIELQQAAAAKDSEIQDLKAKLDAEEVARVLGLASGRVISVYKARYANFPKPAIERGRCRLWLREDVEGWGMERGTNP